MFLMIIELLPYEALTYSTIGSPASQNINWLPKNTDSPRKEMETNTIYRNRPAILPEVQLNVLDAVRIALLVYIYY